MISAAESRKIAEDYNNAYYVREIENIEHEIRKAASIGERSISLYNVSVFVKDYLKENGYGVKGEGDQRDGFYTKISW